MAIASMRFHAGAATFEESKNGVLIFAGEASTYQEWVFRSIIRLESANGKEEQRALNMIIEGLRGEASQVAMDIGHEELMKETG